MSSFHTSNLRSSVTAQFPSFTVRRGDDVAQSEAEGDCEFEYNITASPNYRFYIASTSYHDDVDVAQGMTATHYMDYFFQDKREAYSTSWLWDCADKFKQLFFLRVARPILVERRKLLVVRPFQRLNSMEHAVA